MGVISNVFMLSDHLCHLLRLDGQFDDFEGMGLRLRILGAVQAIQDQLPKEWEPNLPGQGKMLLAFVVDKVEMVTGGVPANVDVFAQLDGAIRAQDETAAIAPHGHSRRA